MRNNIVYTVYIICIFLWIVIPENAMHAASPKKFTVVIDAGHGGHDPGAIGKRGKEKNINLSVALKLGKLIQNNHSDTKVVYTRSSDVFVPLHRRAEIANEAKADLFISIHTNSIASRSSRVSGTETYTLGLHRTQENLEVAQKENAVILIEDDYQKQYAGFNPNSSESYIIFEFLQDKNMAQSVNFAQLIQQQFRHKARRIDKGVHQAGFLVLRETSMPSVLIELGYITNPNEEAYLLSSNGSSMLAQSIYQAFVNYKANKKTSSPGVLTSSQPVEVEEDIVIEEPTAADTQPVQTAQTAQPKEISRSSKSNTSSKPVFKIQILTSDKVLPKNSRQFKGLSPSLNAMINASLNFASTLLRFRRSILL